MKLLKTVFIGLIISSNVFAMSSFKSISEANEHTIKCSDITPGKYTQQGYLVVEDGDGEYGIKNPILIYSVVNDSLKICTSHVTNMRWIFYDQKFAKETNISNWDVSNVTDMSKMFVSSNFNGDISGWNVSKVANMSLMFAQSKFNGDISNWDVSKVTDMSQMFALSKFNGDISKWNVSNVKNMSWMFTRSDFNSDISNWDVGNVQNMTDMFADAKFDKNISNWNVSNVTKYKDFAVDSPLRNNPAYMPDFKS